MIVQFNLFLWGFLFLFAAGAVTRWVLTRINISHLRRFGHRVPEVFRGEIDGETLSRMTNYTAESSRLGSVEALFDDAVLLTVLLGGLIPWLVVRVEALQLNPILSGLIFFAILALAGTVLDIPFSLYATFGIEKKYGFSTITPALWISDFIKSTLISAVLLALLLAPLLALILYAPATWWVWAWIFFALFQLLILWLYPIAIAPLFNKYEPIRDEVLKERIIALLEKAGLRIEGVYQVDASRRSRHSNAYFTGVGKTKRIVLFDTLLGSHAQEEILAVLAHEAGHWKRKHVLKQLLFIETVSFFLFYAIYRLLEWPLLYSTFGVGGVVPYAGLFLISAVLKPIAFLFTPAGAAVSRTFEREADEDSFSLLGSAGALASALKRLAKDNLANLHPHPLYAWFYYSHPPLAERIESLQRLEQKAP